MDGDAIHRDKKLQKMTRFVGLSLGHFHLSAPSELANSLTVSGGTQSGHFSQPITWHFFSSNPQSILIISDYD